MPLKLLGTENAKTPKGREYGYETAILYLSSGRKSGHNVCPDSTPACLSVCLDSAGFGIYNKVKKARARKTNLFYDDKPLFEKLLMNDIAIFDLMAARKKLKPCIRLNGTSDIAWEKELPSVFQTYSTIQFYDYTKSILRMKEFLTGNMPANYHLTYSISGEFFNEVFAHTILKRKEGSVAVVFDLKKKDPMIDTWRGFPIIDGDLSDLRFLDPAGVVVGLRAKGKARKPSLLRIGFVKKGVNS